MAHLERTFLTRGYELDRTGIVPVSTLAEYFEHLRWEALGDPTFGLNRLFHDDHHMVVRAQTISVAEPIGVNVSLRGSLWISRTGKSSLDLGHRLAREDGREVATAVVTGVHLSPEGRPQSMPAEVRALATEGSVPSPERLRDGAPEGAWSAPVAIRPSDIDLLQHVNHAMYIRYVEDARVLAAAAGAYGEGAGVEEPIRRLTIEYLGQAVLGDEVQVRSWRIADGPATLGFELCDRVSSRTFCRARIVLSPPPPVCKD